MQTTLNLTSNPIQTIPNIEVIELGALKWTISKRDDLTKHPNYPYMCKLEKATPKGKYKKSKTLYSYVYRTYEEAKGKANKEFDFQKNRVDLRAKESQEVKRLNAEMKAMDHYSIGEILLNTWGYEQTNVEFYKVLEVKNKTLKVIRIGSTQHGELESHGMACNMVPDIDKEIREPFILRLKIRIYNNKPNCVICNPQSYYYFHKWNGEPQYCSWYA